jgi:hypothetical protein
MPIPLRADFNTQTVRAAAKRSKDGAQARRLLALAAIYEGARLGTSSSINPGASCPSECATGPTGPNQGVLVLRIMQAPEGVSRRALPTAAGRSNA